MPKIKNIIFDKTWVNLGLNLFPRSLPKNRAIELLKTIPKIEPKIRDFLYSGYLIPRPREARKVLSPISPIIILKATTKIQFVLIFKILSRKTFLVSFSFLLGRKPKIPNNKKEIYVKIFNRIWKFSFSKYVKLLPNKIAIPWLKKVPIAIPK